ncbi:MAG: suppressor of fused domain protein [Thermoanaerobaculia bacterium]|nr:suppressor of fused domain protein [Thermoanaerobaculia bacterium]
MRPSDRVKAHLERLLGPAVATTTGRDLAGDREASFAVATFPDQPTEGATTLVTVGLSSEPLTGPEGEQIRQELLLCAWNKALGDRLYKALFATAQAFRDLGETANPGAIVELDEPLAEPSGLELAFLYDPTYHAEELATVPAADAKGGEPIEIVWLIPITESEAELIEAEGPEAFESYLAATDPDLLDVTRAGEV